MQVERPIPLAEEDRQRLNAILQEAQAGRLPEAIAGARAALEGGLEHPLVLNLAALGLEQEGRGSEAEELLRRAVRIAPRDVGSRNALGLCLLQLQRPREALEEFDAVLELDPKLPYAHANRGNALRSLGWLPEAEASFRRAIDLDSRHGAALAAVAALAAQRGAYAQARFWAEKALAVAPGLPEAILSGAVADLGERQLERAETSVRALLDSGALSPLDRSHAEGLLGDILDAAGRYPEAFSAYAACNEARQKLYAGRFDSSLEFVRGLSGWFDGPTVNAWKERPAGSSNRAGVRDHVFIIGFPRSGVTLLNTVLAGHPSVVGLERQELLIDAVHQFMARPNLDALASAPPRVLEQFRAAYWERVAAAGVVVKDKIFVDSHSLNSLKLPLLARLFPTAKILFACRDPRDTVLSCFRNRFGMSAPAYELLTLEGAARYYDAVLGLTLRLTNLLPLQVCLVRHEDVITAFMREMKRVCEFLALEWHPGMGDFALRERDATTPMPRTSQLLHGLGTEGVGLWHHYRTYLEPTLPTLEPWVKQFYY